MRHWPWITIVVAVVLALMPPGLSVIDNALFSGERLSRSIAGFMLTVAAGGLLALGVLEWLVFRLLRRRRARSADMA